MDRDRLRRLLEEVRQGRLDIDQALGRLRLDPLERLGFATLDLHRAVRCGFPEVVYGPGKTPQQVAEIVDRLAAAGQTVLVTRVGPDVHQVVRRERPGAIYHPEARAISLAVEPRPPSRPGVVVVTAGTADIPVAEEAILVAELAGNRVERVFDVGVAGLHRLLARLETLVEARVIVVVAGMEGALASVVTGLVDCPVIGVPTSVGEGAGARGQAALLAMLNSCAAGLTVVNIDNGFGAGYAAAQINRPDRADNPPASETRDG